MSLAVLRRKYKCLHSNKNGEKVNCKNIQTHSLVNRQNVVMKKKQQAISASKIKIKKNIHRNKYFVNSNSSKTLEPSINYHSYYNKKHQRCKCDKSLTVKSRVQERKTSSQQILEKKLKVLQCLNCKNLDIYTDAAGLVAGKVQTLLRENPFIQVGMVVNHPKVPVGTTIVAMNGKSITLSEDATAIAGVQKLVLRKEIKPKKSVCINKKIQNNAGKTFSTSQQSVGYTRKNSMKRYCNTTKDMRLKTSSSDQNLGMYSKYSYNSEQEKKDGKIKDSSRCGVYN